MTDNFFQGEPTVTPCTSDGVSIQFSGCIPQSCNSPSDEDRLPYNINEISLNRGDDFEVTATCKTNYYGTPTVSMCDRDNTPYTLSGC